MDIRDIQTDLARGILAALLSILGIGLCRGLLLCLIAGDPFGTLRTTGSILALGGLGGVLLVMPASLSVSILFRISTRRPLRPSQILSLIGIHLTLMTLAYLIVAWNLSTDDFSQLGRPASDPVLAAFTSLILAVLMALTRPSSAFRSGLNLGLAAATSLGIGYAALDPTLLALSAGALEGLVVGIALSVAWSLPGSAMKARWIHALGLVPAAIAAVIIVLGFGHFVMRHRYESRLEAIIRRPLLDSAGQAGREPPDLERRKLGHQVRLQASRLQEILRRWPRHAWGITGQRGRPFRDGGGPLSMGTEIEILERALVMVDPGAVRFAQDRSFLSRPADLPETPPRLLPLVVGTKIPAHWQYHAGTDQETLVLEIGGLPFASITLKTGGTEDHQEMTLDSIMTRAVTFDAPRGLQYRVQTPSKELDQLVYDRLHSYQPFDRDFLEKSLRVLARLLVSKNPVSPALESAAWEVRQSAPHVEAGPDFCVGDLHTHTAHCVTGSASAELVARRAFLLGMDFIGITEHLARSSRSAAQDAREQLAPKGTVIPGQEIMLSGAHITIFGHNSWLEIPWYRYGSDPDSLQDRLAPGSLAIHAHANHPPSLWQARSLARGFGSWPNAVELSGWMTPATLDSIPQERPLIGGSDSHNGLFGGSDRTLVFSPSKDTPSILDAIHQGRSAAVGPQIPGWIRCGIRARPYIRSLAHAMLRTDQFIKEMAIRRPESAGPG